MLTQKTSRTCASSCYKDDIPRVTTRSQPLPMLILCCANLRQLQHWLVGLVRVFMLSERSNRDSTHFNFIRQSNSANVPRGFNAQCPTL